jgi:MFS transporter, DHA3 family, macrolide efflux protein
MDEVSPAQVTYRSLLRNRNYTFLWIGQIVSIFGDRLHQVALLVLVASLANTNMGEIGLIFATIALPSLLFGPFAGAFVDRWNRQWVMISADLIRVGLVLAIPILGRVDILYIYVLTFLLTTVGLFFQPARDSIMPNIVPEQSLLSANSFAQATGTTMDVLGYPLAGALVGGLVSSSGVGVDVAFYIDAGTYLFSAIMIMQMSIPSVQSVMEQLSLGGLFRMVGDGIRFVRSNSILLTNILIMSAGALVAGGETTLSFGYATKVTNTGGFGYAILEGAIGLGNVIGGLVVGAWGQRYRKGILILVGLIVMGAANAALVLFTDLWLAAAMMLITGIGNMFFFIPGITLTQEHTPDVMRGRVLSFRQAVVRTALIVSNSLAGFAAQWYGVQQIYLVAGSLLMLVGGLGFLIPSARDAD